MNDKTKGDSRDVEETAEHDCLESELQRWGVEAGSRTVPDSIENVLSSGISSFSRTKKSIRIRRSSYAAGVALLLIFVLMTANVSSVFAAALQHIPGMSRILSLIGSDPGLNGAIEHDYMQPVGLSDTHDGTQFTVDGIISDEVRMNVFYTLRLDQHQGTNNLGRMEVLDGETLLPVQAMYSYNMELDKDGSYHGILDIQMANGVPVPDTLCVAFSPNDNDLKWNVTFPVDKLKSTGKEEIIEVHKVVTVDGQKITIERVNIYPLRLTVDVSFDSSNSKRIFQMNEMSIVNEKGEVLKNKSAFLGEAEQTLHFDSSYFDNPKRLTLKVGRIMALDKDKLTLKLDLNKKEIVQAPDDQISLTSVSQREDGSYELNLRLQGPTIETDHFGYMLGYQLTDSRGKAYTAGLMRSGLSGNTANISLEILSDHDLRNPVSIKLDNYPAWIDEPFEVKLK